MKTNRLLSRDQARALDLTARIELEREVTDAIGEQIRLPSIPADWKFSDYSNRTPWRRYMFDCLGEMKGKSVMDLGCGYNPTSVYFALAGAGTVAACDVSPKALEYIDNLAEEHGVRERVQTHLGPAEHLPFDDESFDIVHGEAVLHHLDLPRAGAEIARVLKPGGKAVFKDPLGQNPVLEFARDYLPYGWKSHAKGTDCPLTFQDIDGLARHFSRCTYRGFGFFSMAATAVLGRGKTPVHTMTHRMDEFFLPRLRFLQRFCRFVVIRADKAGPESQCPCNATGLIVASKGE